MFKPQGQIIESFNFEREGGNLSIFNFPRISFNFAFNFACFSDFVLRPYKFRHTSERYVKYTRVSSDPILEWQPNSRRSCIVLGHEGRARGSWRIPRAHIYFFCERVNESGIKSFTRGLRDDFHLYSTTLAGIRNQLRCETRRLRRK